MSEMSFEEYICVMVREWVNHPKNGYGRREFDLKRFEKFWNNIIEVIVKIEKGNYGDKMNEFVQMVKYEGKLFRYHSIRKKAKVNYHNYYVSWTITEDPKDFYWIYRSSKLLKLTANTKSEDCLIGINLQGLESFIQKYWNSKYYIGSPAILKEQEVVFRMNREAVIAEDIIIVE